MPIAIGEEITERGFRYTFRTGQNPAQAISGEVDLVKFLNKGAATPAKRIAIMDEDSLAGQSEEKWRRKLFTEAGFEVVASIFYPASTRDLSAEVSKLKAMRPDFLLRQCYLSDAILLTRSDVRDGFQCDGHDGSLGRRRAKSISPSLASSLNIRSSLSVWDPRIKIPGVKEVAAVYKREGRLGHGV